MADGLLLDKVCDREPVELESAAEGDPAIRLSGSNGHELGGSTEQPAGDEVRCLVVGGSDKPFVAPLALVVVHRLGSTMPSSVPSGPRTSRTPPTLIPSISSRGAKGCGPHAMLGGWTTLAAGSERSLRLTIGTATPTQS
jgi:hypothetical protein